MKGIHEKLLEVDLTAGTTRDLPIPEEAFRRYLGGRGLGARLLFDVLPAGVDPLSPDNVLIFLTGPLTGSMATGSSKFVVVTKSPVTHAWCDSYSSGRISVQLKKIGYDGMLVRGKANHPCYLRIDGTGVEIRDATALWGTDSFTTERRLKEAEGDASVGVSSIGPAGEKLVKIACINSDLYRQAGRGGVGAVMGSKNLKAIVVRGAEGAGLHDRKRLIELNRQNYQRALVSQVAQARMKYGTPLTLNVTHAWCDSYSSGRISVQLKKIGYDGMMVRGKANHPCYLRIDGGGVEIRDATPLWGTDSFTTERRLKEEEGDASVGVSSIGPAGEKLVKIACINSDLYRQAGR
ncbi:MAG TPA: aldehyde ferredoxin oxidoreductase N-terminal domain-containing protein, partial [Candidatus Methylomirabilis sp.]|nr:aldehyde ferredoxin oxidoreductase N-terminal domain-containing protein [Candidatus Methylomirabilis sp.]